MGEIVVTDSQGTPVEFAGDLKEAILARIETSIENTDMKFRKNNSSLISFLEGLLSFKITHGEERYEVSYIPGRKDAVLARMYEEGYVTESELKKNFFRGLDYTFTRGNVSINAPHFVFWIIKLLEENYDKEILRKGGLTITTSLDYKIQRMAEQSVEEHDAHLASYGAGNAALIYLDSLNGDVIAYVGSKDYYNEEIDGQVDIVQSARQPGSTMKPLVYGLGFMNLPLTLDSPIYDTEMRVGANRPNNADGEFLGLMSLKNALAYSRNIPAIKMFFSIGGEEIFKEFLTKLGVTSLRDEAEYYGYPMAIGAAEIPMFELATAYSHLSAQGKPAVINPILEIRSADGSLLYSKQEAFQEEAVPAGVAYLLWQILSDKSNFPTDWVGTFTYPTIRFATKSGTTNVVKRGVKLPRDGWLATYTPSKVAIFWAGNTDGSALSANGFGGWLNSPIWKSFIKKLEQNGQIQDQMMPQMEVKSVSVSKVSGKLSSFETPLPFMETSLGYINSLPSQIDANVVSIEVDSLC